MMIIGGRSNRHEEAFEDAIYRAPHVWAHARRMRMFQRMNVMDQETFRMATSTMPSGWKSLRWVSSIPLSVATILNHDHPEVFGDVSGRTMDRFLARNPQYAVPQESQRKVFF